MPSTGSQGFLGHSCLRSRRSVVLALFFLPLLYSWPAAAQTYNVLHSFNGLDGGTPTAGLTIDAAGNLYGTTLNNTLHGHGGVFELQNLGMGHFMFNVLYSFISDADGTGPYGRVILGPGGSLYGTTVAGGQGLQSCNYGGWPGCGTVFQLLPPVSVCKTVVCPWLKGTLYEFAGVSDGAAPQGDLTLDHATGNLYGTTIHGGISSNDGGYGVVYQLTPPGRGWMESVLYQAPADNAGAYPYDGIIFDAGNLYGVFAGAGPYQGGAVYELTPSGSGWTEQTVHGFPDPNVMNDGSVPKGGLIVDSAGNLYGTTTSGGMSGGTGGGTVFKLTPSNGSWIYSVLYRFPSGRSGMEDGPQAKLYMDASGNLYGTTVADGMYDYGSVFKLTPSGGIWTYSSLHDFCRGGPPCSDGAFPYSNLVFDREGNLYGTASQGGENGLEAGVVFEITP